MLQTWKSVVLPDGPSGGQLFCSKKSPNVTIFFQYNKSPHFTYLGNVKLKKRKNYPILEKKLLARKNLNWPKGAPDIWCGPTIELWTLEWLYNSITSTHANLIQMKGLVFISLYTIIYNFSVLGICSDWIFQWNKMLIFLEMKNNSLKTGQITEIASMCAPELRKFNGILNNIWTTLSQDVFVEKIVCKKTFNANKIGVLTERKEFGFFFRKRLRA